jgi:hypothetical protein
MLTLLLCLALDQESPRFTTDELRIETYLPTTVDADSLFETVNELCGRWLLMDDREVRNLNLLYDRLLIYDTAEQTARIRSLLETIESSFMEQEAFVEQEEPLAPTLLEFNYRSYRLGSLSLDSAMRLLAPYQRAVQVTDELGNWVSFDNISPVDGSLLLLRDRDEHLDAMEDLLRVVDRPSPQVQIQAWVLSGALGDEGAAAPAEMAGELARLVPGTDFRTDAHGLLRTAVGDPCNLELSLRGVMGSNFSLEIFTGPYDHASQTLTLDSCALMLEFGEEYQQLFRTNTTISAGQYAVIGISGSDPLLLALRIQPL